MNGTTSFSHSHRTWIEIDRSALRHNVAEFRRFLSPSTKLLAVVKANAYGHGLTVTARAIEDVVDWFGVDSLEEGIELRDSGIRSPILVLGFTPAERASEIVRHDLRQVVYDLETVGALDDASRHLGQRAAVHLKIETGLVRQGIPPEDLPRFLAALPEFPGVELEGITTHFANADDVDDPSFTLLQLARFHMAHEILRSFGIRPRFRHISASAATMLYPDAHFDLVRVGIALYGLLPSPNVPQELNRRGTPMTLEPVLRLKTRIAQLSSVPAGTAIGYGLSERVARDSKVAVLPLGYADGYDRRLSSQGEVLISGKRAKVLGRVMMNIIVVDVTDIKEARPGAVATVIGRDGDDAITIDEIAERIGTINYEVVSRLNPLLPRLLL
jgi:alanine racemase